MSANTPSVAAMGLPVLRDDLKFYTGRATGVINAGDQLIYSGHWVIPTAMAAGNTTQVNASGAGIAMESNPVYDSHGVQKENTALMFADNVRILASAYHKVTASAHVTLGGRVYPATTGSGVMAPTGNTGVGAQWGTADPKTFSGATAAVIAGNGIIVGVHKLGSDSGETQLEILYRAHGNFGYGG